MNSQYERGMTWDSRCGREGMHILDARPDKNGDSTDTYMRAEIERITDQNKIAGSAAVELALVAAA
jgi:hypothetical protein